MYVRGEMGVGMRGKGRGELRGKKAWVVKGKGVLRKIFIVM